MKLTAVFAIILLGGTPSVGFPQVQIARVSSSSVTLQPGGQPVSVTIEGVNLTSVSAAELLLRGRSVVGLTGVLKPVRSITRIRQALAVELTAGPTAPAGTYQLALVAGRDRVQVPVSVVVAASSPLQPAPTVSGNVDVSPGVTGATPQTLSLAVGGPAQTVVLTGVRLNELSGAHVERNGSRVAGVQVELPGSADATRREVRLTATASAGPPWDVPLDLIVRSRLGTLVKSITVPVHITAAAPPAADLVVMECRMEAAPDLATVYATIRNTGSEGIAFQTGQDVAKATGLGTSGTARAPGGGLFIPAGGSVEVSARLWSPPTVGSHAVNWMADPLDLIPESNPGNNDRACTHVVEPEPPGPGDLIVSHIAHQPHSGPPGTTFTFDVTIQNVGAPFYPPGPYGGYAWVTCTINGGDFEGGSFGLGVGTGVEWANNRKLSAERKVTANLAPGSKTLECTVDPDNHINEANENNNKQFVVFVVTNGR